MQRLLLKWRVWKIDANIDYGDFKLGGGYSIAFRYNASRKWYVENCSVNILDKLITEYVDIGRVSNDARKDKLFAVVEFDETMITGEDLAFDLMNDYKEYGVNILPMKDTTDAQGNIIPSEAKTFLRDFTNCEEKTDGVTSQFTLRQESTDTDGNVTPAYYIIL